MGTVMRDSLLPAIWGQHTEALFNPVIVRDRLVTSVERAPAEWSHRLDDLGFKKGSRAWLRLGPITQSEFEYLSPSIVLKGFRPEDLVNTSGLPEANPVPVTVRDEIAELWQNNLDAILFELSLHDVTTKAQAWTHVEAAIEGDATPEAVAITELAFARMYHQGRLSGDALDYAIAQNWEGMPLDEVLPRGKPILGAGDSVHWADSTGVIHSGRLACPLREGDSEAWVYEQGPKYVGGICTSTLGSVSRDQIQYLDSGQDWSTEFVLDSAATHIADALEFRRPSTLDLSSLPPDVASATLTFLRSSLHFPEDRWRLDLELRSKSDPVFGESREHILQVLEGVESDLIALSRHFYGAIGVGFCLAPNRASGPGTARVAMRVGNYNELGFFALAHGVPAVPVFDDGLLDYSTATATVDASLREQVIAFERQAEALGSAVGVKRAVPLDFYLGHRLANSLAYLQQTGSGAEFSSSQLQIIATVAGDRHGVAKDAIHPVSGEQRFDLELFNYPIPTDSPDIGYGQLSLGISRVTAPLVDLADVLREIQSGGATRPDPIVARVSFAEVTMRNESAAVAELSKIVGGISSSSGSQITLVPHVDHANAANPMRQFIDLLDANELTGERAKELDVARMRLDSFPLLERFYKAIETTKNADEQQLRAWAKNELMRSFQGRITEWSEAGQERLVSEVCRNIRGSQGIVVALTAGPKRRYYMYSVPGKHDAVIESRDAALGRALVDYKETYKRKAKHAVFDAIAFSDPELCSLLAGDRAGIEKVAQQGSSDYQDTGMVAGYARKDIRGFNRDDLQAQALKMSPEQKGLYLKRELIWPRMSFEEMKEQGIHLYTAVAIDTLWKSMPKAPKSLAAAHVTAFTELVCSMRDGVTSLLGKLKSGELQDTAKNDTGHINGASLDGEFRAFTRKVCYSESVRGVYQNKDLKVRGLSGVSIRDYSPFTGSLAMFELLKASTWEQNLKSKRIARQSTGSRVMRGEVVRTGDDHRNGMSVNTEDFLRTFGFSGVEYGNWTNQKEREKHMNFSYDSMMDFATLLRWEPMALSLGGRLGLCIGSRGEGGSRAAAAHFEPANYAMNLTRMSGDGSLAHEYFHALANHFGHIHTGKPQDLLDTFAFALQRPGSLPILNKSNLREPVRKAFRDLQVAIMRKPAPGTDESNIENYTELSEMMRTALATSAYHAEPCEMFARAMEIWFADQLQFQGKRNDYLVRAGKGGELYPDADHLNRINLWVSPLLEAIELEVRSVSHPLMGDIEMPVLHSEARSSCPLTPKDLVELASHELDRLFARAAPKLMLYSTEGGKSGFYQAALDVVGLNDRYADKETLYHEAWHACEAKLLTVDERQGLNDAFGPASPLAAYVAQTMRHNGMAEIAVNAALESPTEMQAYAFQLWAVGKLDLTEQRLTEFYTVRGFVDDVTGVASLLGGENAKAIFGAFMSGELASRSDHALGLAADRGVSIHLSPPIDEEEEDLGGAPARSYMRMG